MKVLITGSSGSLGTVLVNSLVEKKINVTGLDIIQPAGMRDGEYFRFVECSITDKENLRNVFREVEPTHVIHLACTFNKVRSRKKEYEIDIGGSRNILELCDLTSSVKQLVFSSSTAAYGAHRDNPEWITENDPLRPGNYRYGLNKKLIEDVFTSTAVREDLRIVFCRICTVIGPTYNKPASIVSILLRLPWLPRFVKENKIQFLHSDDFASLMGFIISDDRIRGTFNVAPDSFVAVKDIVPGKRFLPIPAWAIKLVLAIFWYLKILNLEPAAMNASIYPILLDPSKIVARFNYKFNFSSAQTFEDVKINNMIPPSRM